MLLFIFACVPLSGEGDWTPVVFTDPEIESFVWECSEEEATWSFAVQTAGWTGNGKLWLMDTALHLEEHPILSIGAAADQSEDLLFLELPVVGDWRDAQRGKSTRFSCAEADSLSILLKIYHPETLAESDCRYIGLWEDEENLPSCDIPWTE